MKNALIINLCLLLSCFILGFYWLYLFLFDVASIFVILLFPVFFLDVSIFIVSILLFIDYHRFDNKQDSIY